MIARLWKFGGLAAVVLLLAGAALTEPFDHWQHRKLFTSCGTCHVGAKGSGGPVFPTAASCATCHDGKVEKQVTYTPRTSPPPSNLRFAHDVHVRAYMKEKRVTADTAAACFQCHSEKTGAEWMKVQRALVGNCFDCHKIDAAHYDAPASECASCHLPLAEARGVPEQRIADWKAPASHDAPDFQETHGDQAKGSTIEGRNYAVSPACATCHARDFCATCHVNAPEEPLIQALQPDRRSLAMKADEMREPASHKTADFMLRHGHDLGRNDLKRCSVCHTSNSCQECHPGRGTGAKVERERPENHGRSFVDGHGNLASASSKNCAGCHTLEQCIDCHRPNQASVGSYHPADFLSRHPVASYTRQTSCQDCHNAGTFCQSCHQQAGLTNTTGAILGTQANFHDASPTFSLGHGAAARQSLESCVSCHAEKDCLVCHATSSVGGRNFNPHGPGFDAERMRKSNQQMCTACHGYAIPSSR
jgi:hypothetical protein